MEVVMKILRLLTILVVASSAFIGVVNASDTQSLVCVDEANQTLIFADGSMYKLLDRDCKKLCPRGLPASCTILPRLVMSSDPTCPCCEITNVATNEKVFAVRIKVPDTTLLSKYRP
jgi:hypothetical protein